jgi:hypothetical protein
VLSCQAYVSNTKSNKSWNISRVTVLLCIEELALGTWRRQIKQNHAIKILHMAEIVDFTFFVTIPGSHES